MAPRLRDAGDSALLLEFEPRVDPEVNARAIAVAAAVRRAAIPGVRDVVPTYRSVAVFFDPLKTDLPALTLALEREASSEPAAEASRVVEVPVAYGGELGPDVLSVAAFAKLSPDEVIARHWSRSYRVYMIGFIPGFAYMGTVDEAVAAPRRDSPRLRVPAGSVGIAGRQTGIYPRESPGGWQLIGRTTMRPFDANRTPASIFAPGDTVRFIPVAPESLPETRPPHAPDRTAPSVRGGITVLRPGMLTTVQDLGRWGSQDSGVPVAGPMDRVAHRTANRIVGNPDDAAALEVTLLGPEIRFDGASAFAVSGADLGATLDGRDVPLDTLAIAAEGSVLRFSGRRTGARAALAFAGGIAVPPVLGSRATHLLSEMGGIDGRALKSGDRLPLGSASPGSAAPGMRRRPPQRAIPSGGARVRVLPGPQDSFFDDDALERLQRVRFIISPQSNRMAFRLSGGARVVRRPGMEMISDAAFMGGIQVPPSGEPILLMADRQTSGGYPQIATVISADLPLAGQLAPGDWIEFAVCTRREAVAALLAQEQGFLG